MKMENDRREAEDNDEGIGLLLQHIKDLCGCTKFYKYFLKALVFMNNTFLTFVIYHNVKYIFD